MSKNSYLQPQQSDSPDKKSTAAATCLSDFKIISKLGEGAYSSVYKVVRLADKKEYALKKVKLLNLSDKEKENALNEVRILASVKSKYVIQYKEAFWDQEAQALCIIMEYADNGDLFQKICDHQKHSTEFHENEIWKVIIQVVKALRSLHDMRIMHRDLKSANVFLYKDWTTKLGDMNVSKLSNYKGLNYTQTGTPYYASPEVWRDEPYDSKSDIWSLGCVLYEMITLKPPFRADDMQGLYKRVLKGVFQKIPNHYSADLSNIVNMMLQVKPSLRPSCEQILEMPAVMKRSEKFFPEEAMTNKSVLVQEIKVPKNLMYLTDKLPAANYDHKNSKMFKNKSESKFRLPKLNGQIDQMSTAMSKDTLEYQGPTSKNRKDGSLPAVTKSNHQSIQEQVESAPQPGPTQKKNIQQQQIIIQVKSTQSKDKKAKVSSLISQSSEKQQPQPQKEVIPPSQIIPQQLLLSPQSSKQQQPIVDKVKTTNNTANSSRRQASARYQDPPLEQSLSLESEPIKPITDDKVVVRQGSVIISQTSIKNESEEIKDQMDELPPVINSKSPAMKIYSQKILQQQQQQQKAHQQMQKHAQSALDLDSQKIPMSIKLSHQNSILTDQDTPSQQVYGYRYSSLSPSKKLDMDTNASSYQQSILVNKQLPPVKISKPQNQDMSIDYELNDQSLNAKSLSPYRPGSLLQQPQHKQKQSQTIPKAQSLNKLPMLKAQDQLIKQIQKANYNVNGSQKLQNMYYRVANSYLRGYQPQMNIIGNSLKNSYQVYGNNNNIKSNSQQDPLQGNIYFQPPQKPKKIAQLLHKLDAQQKQNSQRQQKESVEQHRAYIQSIINENAHSNQQSIMIHPLLNNRPNRNAMIGKSQQQTQSSVDLNIKKVIDDTFSQVKTKNQVKKQQQSVDDLAALTRNQSQVLLKYQQQEIKQ